MVNPYLEANILIDLKLKTHYKKFISVSQICRDLHYSNGSVSFWKVMNELNSAGVLILMENYGNLKLYMINYKKLDKYIRQTEAFKLIGKFIEGTVFGHNY